LIQTETLTVLSAHEIYLLPDETVLWTGRPVKQAFLTHQWKNIIRYLLLITGIYLISRLSYFKVHTAGSGAFFLMLYLIAGILICKTIKNIREHDQIDYLITSSRIIIARRLSFRRVIYIAANELVHIELTRSRTDKTYGTAGFKIDSGQVEINDGDEVKKYDYFQAVGDPQVPLQLLENFIAANLEARRT